MNLPRLHPLASALLLATLIAPAPLRAQEDDSRQYRFGIALGGTSVIAVIAEGLEGGRGLELTLGTFSFREVSLSAVVKAYLGPSAFRPAVGAGLWGLMSFAPRAGEQMGAALLARFPIGFDWRLGTNQYIGGEVNVNRALWIRRADRSELPPNPSPIPIPAFTWRASP